MHRHGQPHYQKRMPANSIPERKPKSLLLKIATCRDNRHGAKTGDTAGPAVRCEWICGRAVQALKRLQNGCPSRSSWHKAGHIVRGLAIVRVSGMLGSWYNILLRMWAASV